MHADITMLVIGTLLAAYGSAVTFYSPAAAYINKISLDRRWLPPPLAKYSVQFIDGAFTLGFGASLILAAFLR